MTAVLYGVAVAGWVAAALALLRLRAVCELAARAVHEARNPMAAAWMALHPLASRDAATAAAAASVEAHLRRASRALEDLEASRRARRGPDRVGDLGVLIVLDDLRRTWDPVAAAHGRELFVESAAHGARVTADPVRVAQAAGNLVANALEHGRGRVRIRPSVVGDRLLVEVSDEGGGAPRSPAGSRRAARRGRGLRIAADIAARTGGRLVLRDGRPPVLELPLTTEEAA